MRTAVAAFVAEDGIGAETIIVRVGNLVVFRVVKRHDWLEPARHCVSKVRNQISRLNGDDKARSTVDIESPAIDFARQDLTVQHGGQLRRRRRRIGGGLLLVGQLPDAENERIRDAAGSEQTEFARAGLGIGSDLQLQHHPFGELLVLLAFGIVALLLIELFNLFKKAAERLPIWAPAKGIIGGAALILLTLAFSTQYLGLGLATTQATLQGQQAVWYAFPLKIVFTSITFGFGGSGGIITPIFFIGSTAGALFAQVFGLNSATFAAIGLVAVLAGATNTPIAASIISIELFGPAVAPYAAVACVVSYVMSGHRSIYPSQVLATEKSRSIQVQIGKEVSMGEATVQARAGSVTAAGIAVITKIRGFVAKHFRVRQRRR